VECRISGLQRAKLAASLVLILAAALFAMLHDPTRMDRIVGALGIAVLVVITPFALQQVFRSGPTLTISDAGIDDQRLGVGLIPWRDVAAISVVRLGNSVSGRFPVIELHLKDEAAYLRKWPIWRRAGVPLARAMGTAPFNMNLAWLTPGFALVFEYMKKYVEVRQDA